jgi:hypothetical protein
MSLRFIRQTQQSQRVGDCCAVLSDVACEGFLGEVVAVYERFVRVRLFYGIQILSLDVFDEGDFEGFLVGGFPDCGGDAVEARFLRRSPTAFARDNLKFLSGATDEDGLEDSVCRDGGG